MFVVVWRSPARSQPGFHVVVRLSCNTTDFVIDMLKKNHREAVTGGGLSGNEQVRLFESHDAGNKQTWTLVISNPNGTSCLIKGGEDWMTNPEIPKGDPL